MLRADDGLLDLVAAAARLRRAHFGNTVKVNYLVNLKSGLCPEDCHYCSQRLGSRADILKYTWLKDDEAVAQATAGLRGGTTRICMVSSGRGPTDRDVERVASMVGALKDEHPGSRSARASACSRTGRPSASARRASTPTTTTSTPPSRTTTRSSRATRTPTASTR